MFLLYHSFFDFRFFCMVHYQIDWMYASWDFEVMSGNTIFSSSFWREQVDFTRIFP